MYKKLEEKDIFALLEAGISEFADKGFENASISQIAKRAGLSVGVIYKYYADKDSFFVACVRHSLMLLTEVMNSVESDPDDLSGNVSKLFGSLLDNAAKHKDYFIMYHEITAGGCRKFAKMLAQEIEGISSKVYSSLIENGVKKGLIRSDIDYRSFAFFFDNLLMMIQFSYSCDYYKERMGIYLGEDITDEKLTEEFMKFLRGAFGIGGQP